MSLFEFWKELSAATDQALCAHMGTLFAQYKIATGEMLTADVRRLSRLGGCDERAYKQLTLLMDDYRAGIELIDSAEALAPAVDELLAGIGAILQSRLRHFEETEALIITSNPVADERRGIIERALVYTTRQIEHTAAQFPDTWLPQIRAARHGDLLQGQTEKVHAELVAHIEAEVFPQLYTHYQEGLRFGLLGLDDLHTRKVAALFIDFIQREWEVLADMINVQAAALEALIDTGEVSVPTRVLNILREAYQQTGPLIESLQRLMQTAAPRTDSPGTEYEFFVQTLHVFGEDVNTTPALPDAALFTIALMEEADAIFGQQRITFLEAVYRMQRLAGDEMLLANEAVTVFNTVHQYLIKGHNEANATETSILQGITETLEIKISSLREAIEDFNGETAGLLQAFAQEKNDVTDEIKEAAYRTLAEAWFMTPPESEEAVPAFLIQCQAGTAFAPYRVDYEKHMALYNGKMEKAALRFKREVILYEVGTYEEILTHSVSRLRESESPYVQAAAARLDGTYAALEVLLRKNNITPIRPEPRELFNGKEHDVLIAEKHEDFAKGEIIKRMGSGYRHKDTVLVRANVIAAK